MGTEPMGAKVVPCNPTHGDGHPPIYEGNHRDDHLSYFPVELHSLCGAMTYHHHLRGNVVLFFEQLYHGRSVY